MVLPRDCYHKQEYIFGEERLEKRHPSALSDVRHTYSYFCRCLPDIGVS